MLPLEDHDKAAFISTWKIYDHELEAAREFEGFAEWLHTFNLLRGKKSYDEEDDDSRLVGKFKVSNIGCFLFVGAVHT